MSNKVVLNFFTPEDYATVAQFLLELVKTGLTFDAVERENTFIITLTGGF